MPHRDSSLDTLGRDPWQLLEFTPEPGRAALHETLFSLGNGRIGVRGAHEEGRAWPGTMQDAVFINGFYDAEDIHHPENAYGLARENQFIVRVPNGKAIRWWVDGEPFEPTLGRLESYRRSIDMRTGVLTREFVWRSPGGRRIEVRSRRVVCQEREHVYAIEYELRSLGAGVRLVLESTLDAQAHSIAASEDPRVGSAHAANALERVGLERAGGRVTLAHRTRRSGLRLISSIEQSLHVAASSAVAQEECGDDDNPGLSFSVTLAAGERAILTKYCVLVSSLDAPAETLPTLAVRQLAEARAKGFSALCAEQQSSLARFWQDADIELEGDAALQQGLRFNLLQLLQSAGRDGRTNIAAKGVTGSGYDGHYFWDTEIYVLPALLHIRPQIARKLLEYRFRTLPAARARARELNHEQGALFAWRTISGPECSAYFPASTAQFHINADIAYAVRRYWEATGDDAFMLEFGAELVFETARIWLGIGHFDASGRVERFCIPTVTGPDEYTALVDNNFYTNAMARMHLAFAAEVAQWLGITQVVTLQRLSAGIGLAVDEPARWRRAAERMYLPFDAARGIHPQDDGFLAKPRWEAATIPRSKRPLLLHYHSLVIYRHQICKQADVLLALLLLDDEFALDVKRRDFDYYEPLTTHDSSLSRCIFGVIASEVGYDDKAYDYFVDGARADLDDRHGNTAHGVHTAAMAGSWLGIVAGFAGFRMHRGLPSFAPRLPAAWTRLAFKLRIGATQLQVAIDRSGAQYRLLSGDMLVLQHFGVEVLLGPERPERSFPSGVVARA